jgi:hypothetical protein
MPELDESGTLRGLRAIRTELIATRRLAAILAADVAGYARLIDPTIAAHNGRLASKVGLLTCPVRNPG